jgi:methionyl-tRNA synthetase
VGCETFYLGKDLIDGKCPEHHTAPEIVEEENYFFKLSKYLPQVKELISTEKIKIVPESKKNEILGMIDQGMDDVSFSRTKEKYWGWPVPGDESQVLYVWQDALPNYISAVGYADNQEKFKKYWPADVHCIGKDIVKFHAIYWPAMLLSAKLDLPKTIFVHGFINVAGQKMSKSLGNVIDPFELVKKYGVDAVRYFLLREIPSVEDGDFTYEKFETRYNADLAGGIGNLVARTLGIAKGLKIERTEAGETTSQKIKEIKERYITAIDSFKLNEALIAVWELIGYCDKYINDQKLWQTKDRKVINDLFIALSEISIMLNPFMPVVSMKINEAVASGQADILFPRLS